VGDIGKTPGYGVDTDQARRPCGPPAGRRDCTPSGSPRIAGLPGKGEAPTLATLGGSRVVVISSAVEMFGPDPQRHARGAVGFGPIGAHCRLRSNAAQFFRSKSDGNTHQHITHLWWINPSTGKTGDNTRAALVDWIENQDDKAYVDEGGHRVNVYVVTPTTGAKFLRTYADGEWKNNLLALPQK
jgi:Protein of unknown function (DUF3892)